MLLDHDVLIDAGTGVGDLSLAELSRIDHVFITHSHLDHTVCLPLLLDSVYAMRDRPLTVYGIPETLEILQQHMFNWKLWPDFTHVPNAHQAALRYQAIEVGHPLNLNGRNITALPAEHTVPAVGFRLDSGKASLVFSGDTTTNDALWDVVNRIDNLRYLIIETAFSNAEKSLAMLSKHLCPALLADELLKLKRNPKIYITHLKPGEIEVTMKEIAESVRGFDPIMLKNGDIFEF